MKKILNNKIFRIFYNTIKAIFITIVVLYVLVLVIQKVSNNSSILGYRVFTIATSSMEPEYKVGDVILVHEEDYSNIEVGDDVTYMGKVADFKDRIVTHRVIEMDKEKKTLITKGIANEEQDPQIDSTQLFGKVSYRFIFISLLTHLIRNKLGFYFLIFIPLVLVAFLEIADFFTKPKDDESEENEKDIQ